MQPILKEMRDAPLEFRFRSDSVALTIECLIKAIEARTMDTGIPGLQDSGRRGPLGVAAL